MGTKYKLALVGGLLLAATSASAQVTRFDVERLWLDPAATSSMVIGTGEIGAEGVSRLSVAGHWEHQPLVLNNSTEYFGHGILEGGKLQNNIVADRLTLHFGAAVSISENLEVSLRVPVVTWQNGSPDRFIPKLPRSGLGTPGAGLRYVLNRQTEGNGFNAAIAGEVMPNIGDQPAWAGNKFWAFTPRVELGHRFSDVVVGGQFGALLRSKPVKVNGEPLGSEILWGLVAATTGAPLRFEGSVRGNLTTNPWQRSAEILVGARYALCSRFETFILGGPGFFKEPGTPQWRGVLGVAYTGAPKAKPVPKVDPCAPGQAHTPAQCPNLDDDGDGVKNADDACPTVAGLAELKGCPPVDTDGDGIPDNKDKCPTVPGVAELEGCPAVDTDGDGVPDHKDKCPTVPGVAELEGCPAVDTDGDGIPDHKDKCPTVAGVAQYEGCPPPKAAINTVTKKIDILEKVYFDTGKASIQARSFSLLDEVAKVLNDNPQYDKVMVEGHTDSTGPAALNKTLSANRAAAVKAYLVQKGVTEARLESKGFGPDKPIGDNKTAAGREQNRRVEFLLP
jgi:outer membrane protein OmpA-like peptidoglycan-associated protein